MKFREISLNVSYTDGTIRAPHCAFDEPFFNHLNKAAIELLRGVDVPHGGGETTLQSMIAELPQLSELISASIQEVGRDLGGFCFPERNAGGVAVADFDGDGLLDIYLPRLHKPGVLLQNQGPPHFLFRDVTSEANLDSETTSDACMKGGNGAIFVDVDNDGDKDLYVSTVGGRRHCLWINRGDGTFYEDARRRGASGVLQDDPSLTSGGSAIAIDYDNDGFLDLYVTEWRFYFLADANFARKTGRRSNARLLRNRGGDDAQHAGYFDDVTSRAGLDLDDITSARLEMHRDRTNELAIKAESHGKRKGVNLPPSLTRTAEGGNGRRRKRAGMRVPMVDVVPDGIFTFAPIWADLDGDSYPDLFVAGDFKTSMMFWNNGNGTFTERTLASGLGLDENGMGVAVGDFDGDLRLDIFVSAIYADHESRAPRDPTSPFGSKGNVLYRNLGDRQFEEVHIGVEDGGWAWGAAFLDADNDGRLEIFLANGFRVPESTYDDLFWNESPNRFWTQTLRRGESRWHEIASAVGLGSMAEGRGVAIADVDGDGLQDIVVANHVGSAVWYRNEATCTHSWIRVRVRECGGDGKGCRDSRGAVVRVEIYNDDEDAPHRRRVSVVGSAGGFLGQSQLVAHFGGLTDRATRIELSVQWPGPVFRNFTLDASALNRTVDVRKGSSSFAKPSLVAPVVQKWSPSSYIATERHLGAPSVSSPPFRALLFGESDGVEEDDADLASGEMRTIVGAVARDVLKRMKRRRGNDDANVREYRTIDGSNNNRRFPLRGASFTPFLRKFPAEYEDNKSAPSGPTRPSARKLSNRLFGRRSVVATQGGEMKGGGMSCKKELSTDEREPHLNELALHFGQLLAHDISHSTPQPNVAPAENFPILLSGDRRGNVIRFRRTSYTTAEASTILFGGKEDGGEGEANDSIRVANPHVREQINKVTSFVDASVVYGSDPRRSSALRVGRLGLMRSSTLLSTTAEEGGDSSAKVAEYPPINDGRDAYVPNDNPLGHETDKLFACGDTRANIQPGLLAMHTMWLREHNWIARRFAKSLADLVVDDEDFSFAPRTFGDHGDVESVLLRAFGSVSVDTLDDLIFEESRRLLIAEFQIVAYREYLPTLLGDDFTKAEKYAYDADAHPSVSNVVATAALRFGHTHVIDTLARVLPNARRDTSLALRDAYFMTASEVAGAGGIDSFLRAYIDRNASLRVGDDVSCDRDTSLASNIPPCASDAIREFLFGSDQRKASGEKDDRDELRPGMDLVAINIQRGRDHGLPNYNALRKSVGFAPLKSIFDFPAASPDVVRELADLYANDIDNVDAFVGLTVEAKRERAFLSPIASRMLANEFRRLRSADRFYYKNDFPDEIVSALEATTGIAQILRRNIFGAATAAGSTLGDCALSPFLARGVGNRTKRPVD